MKNFFWRHPKEKLISLIVGFIIYLSLQILSMTLLHKVYTFGWLADHLYCYTWIAVIVLIAFDQTRLSYFVTFGNVCGAIVGEFLGEFIMEQRMNQITTDMTVDEIEWRRLHYGVFIWFITFIAFLIVGIVVNIILNKKTNQASA